MAEEYGGTEADLERGDVVLKPEDSGRHTRLSHSVCVCVHVCRRLAESLRCWQKCVRLEERDPRLLKCVNEGLR